MYPTGSLSPCRILQWASIIVNVNVPRRVLIMPNVTNVNVGSNYPVTQLVWTPDNCLSNIKPTNSTPGSIISGLKWHPADVDVLRMWGERFLFDCCIYVCLWFMLSGAECIQAETFQILLHFCISQILEYLCIFSNIMLSLPGLAWRRMHPCWDFSDIPPWTNAQSHKANWG